MARRDRAQTRTIARHGRLARRGTLRGLLSLVAASLAVLLVSGVAVAGIAVAQIGTGLNTVALLGEEEGPPPALGSFEGGFNVLIVGSDECEQKPCPPERQARLNDVNILVHVSEDQTHATAVSFPRDLVIPIPSCPREDGKGNHPAMSAQPLNSALSYGGLPCVVETIEKLTGLEIPFAGMITFGGVVKMSTAVGGVTVCTNGPIFDRKANNLAIPAAGEHTLEGEQALGFLRTRYGVGDGSDLGRISNQQVFMSALVRKLTAEGTLSDPTTLYKLATAATDSMLLSNSLSNPTTLVSMATVFRSMELERITFVQYPSATGGTGVYANKVMPVKDTAAKLMEKLQQDLPFEAERTGNGSVDETPEPEVPETPVEPEVPVEPETPVEPSAPVDPNAPVEPDAAAEPEVIRGLLGQSAAQNTCSKANR